MDLINKDYSIHSNGHLFILNFWDGHDYSGGFFFKSFIEALKATEIKEDYLKSLR